MTALRTLLDRLHPLVRPGGRFQRLYPLYEAADSFLYSPGTVTTASPHLRDALDLKRVMITVVVALLPCFLMAFWNTGLQANTALAASGGQLEGWRGALLAAAGHGGDPSSLLDNLLMGAVWFAPVWLVANLVGGLWEALFCIVRRHELNEGFLVTGALFPLICPPTIPLWQVALGISFGVVIAKEIFGGTGKNFLNPALAGRAFLFFAYPAQLSGDRVWVAADGYSGATALNRAAEGGVAAVAEGTSWLQAFLGTMPGSMGETSTLACLLGAAVLLLTGVASWRIMLAVVLGGALTSLLFNLVPSAGNPLFGLPFHWHLVLGGFAFGTVFMATDPVSGAMTRQGQWAYGLLIGSLCILIRVANPAFPEGMMLAILFGNVCAPLIDQLVLRRHISQRRLRHVQG